MSAICRSVMSSWKEVLKEVYNHTHKECVVSMVRERQHADHNTPAKRLSTSATLLDKNFLARLQHSSCSLHLQSFRTESHQHASHADDHRPVTRHCNQNTVRITHVSLSSFSFSTGSFNIPPGTTIPHSATATNMSLLEPL